MSESGLLTPGTHRVATMVSDGAVLATILQVEVAWLRALVRLGSIDLHHADAAAAAATRIELADLSVTEAAGNPVVPMVQRLRAEVDDPQTATLVHHGLTSQDVLDTALILVARNALTRIRDDLTTCTEALAGLARAHRATLMVGRTLTQFAVPITFGLKAAQWLAGVLDARDQVALVLSRLPVQCGGAAGTLALVAELTPDPVAAATAFADELNLVWPGVPWHTTRTPITRIGDALVGTCDALGVLAADVVLLVRPEIGELCEGTVAGRGGSSTMPHKRNPILGILVRSAALQAPMLAAQLHLSAGQAVDERPDGAWHAEWPALRRLLELTVVASCQAAELIAGLEIRPETMRGRAVAAATELLAERDTRDADGARRGDGVVGVVGVVGDGPDSYLGATDRFIEHILGRHAAERRVHG